MSTKEIYKYKMKKGHRINRTFHDNFMHRKEMVLNRRPLKIAIMYLIFGILWIVFSDILVHILSPNADVETLIQTIKGWAFVIATGLLIFGMLSNLFSKIKKLFDELMDSYQDKELVEEELRQNYTELKAKDKLLMESNERYDLALACSNDVIWEWDIVSDRLIFSNKIEDYFDKSLINGNIDNFINYIIKQEDREKYKEEIKKHINGEIDFYKSEFRILQGNGQYIWVLSTGRVIKDKNGKPMKMLGSLKDINERKDYEQNLYKLAFYDPLTGLTNRRFFLNELNCLINKGKTCSVLYIDLDDFKKVNDVFGHEFGDELLIFAGNLLNSIIGEKNLISRTGGDEFSILLRDIKEKDEIASMCDKIIIQFKMPLKVNDKSIYTSLGIGVSIYPDDGDSINSIMKKADIAMYKSKAIRKNSYLFFDKAMSDGLIRKVEIEENLRRANFDEEFDIYYQPQININNNELIGLEALIRWKSNKLGSVPPSEFIPVAEETDLIEAVGEWVIKRVCDDCAKWIEKGYEFNKASINISVKQLQNKEFFNRVKEIIKHKSIEAEYLKFEITESVIINNYNDNIQLIKTFRDFGMQFALDDFGTGNSSINYLRRLPINTLKIDKSFIDNIEKSELDKAIIKELISMSNSIDVDVIVEGVETEGQVRVLREIGGIQIQGYFFSKPLPVNLLERLFNGTVHIG